MNKGLPPYVRPVKGRDGKVRLYYRRQRGGAGIRLHEKPGTEAFTIEVARAANGTQAAPPGTSFSALIRSYKARGKYANLAPRTRQDYDKVLTFIADRIGAQDATKTQRKHVIAWRDQNKGRFAGYLVQVLRVLFEHAIDIGWMEKNPARGVSLPKGKSINRQPWPDDLLDAYRATATGPALLIFEMCLGTGQRIGDVLRMRWDDLDAGGIYVTQGKTGVRLWVPLTPSLASAIDAAPRDGLTILTGRHGKPLSYRAAAHAVAQVRQQIGAGKGYDIHALRHTAASQLAALGLDDDHIAAVTGHTSRASVARYSAAARQRARATKAQERRE